MGGARDKASPRVITILHVRGFLPVCRACICVRAREIRREVDRARTSVCVRSCESESVASMWITRVRVRDPLSLRRPAPLACLSLSAVPYLWPFPYDALGSELRRAPIYAE